ncbi:MAG: Maf family protein [Cytophagales bacterium]|nr:Maf family protein [Cytophagales bacterium]
MKPSFIYLASQSPRRAELLAQLGVSHRLLLADADEDAESLEAIQGRESPTAYVQRVTKLKLEAAAQRAKRRGLLDAPIVCADTTVALGRTIYGKPESPADAARMLMDLSGKTHRVLTAVGVTHVAGKKRINDFALSESRVTFASLSQADIAAYIATGEPFGKAGGYGVQGQAAAFIAKISGSYSGIMGLPLHEMAALLKAAQFL